MITFLLLIVWISMFVLFYAIPKIIVNNYMKEYNLTWDKLCEYDSLNYVDKALDSLGLTLFGLMVANIICMMSFIGTDVTFKDLLIAAIISDLPFLLLFEFVQLNQINHGFGFANSRLDKLQFTSQSHNQSIKI